MNISAQFIFPGIVALVAMIACIGSASAATNLQTSIMKTKFKLSPSIALCRTK